MQSAKILIRWEGDVMKSAVLCLIISLLMVSYACGDLVGLWRFDEGSGSDAFDSSEYGNDGILVADTVSGEAGNPLPAPTTEPNWISGVYGTALQFCSYDDNYNHVSIPKSYSLKTLTNKWTFAMWIRQDSLDPTPGGGSNYARVLSCPMYEIELGSPDYQFDYFWPYGTGALQTDIGESYLHPSEGG